MRRMVPIPVAAGNLYRFTSRARRMAVVCRIQQDVAGRRSDSSLRFSTLTTEESS